MKRLVMLSGYVDSGHCYRTDIRVPPYYSHRMKTPGKLHLIGVDRLDDGALVSFDDGRIGFYSAALLSEMFAQATNLSDLVQDENESEP